MQIEKELISINTHSFKMIENYLARVKEMQFKLGECGKKFKKKDGHLIELVLINLRTPYDVLFFSFHTNSRSWEEDGKDYTFGTFFHLLIKDQKELLDEGKLGGKH